MRRSFRIGSMLLAALFACSGCATLGHSDRSAAQKALPIRVQPISRIIADQPVRGWTAWVDLTDPRVEIRVTGPARHEPNDPVAMETRAQTTPTWLEREHLVLAVNAHFFARVLDPNAPYEPNMPLDLIGPCISDGRLVSPPPATQPSPVLALTRERRGRIGLLMARELEGMEDVVSGALPREPATGGLLVEKGRNVGETASPQPLKRHPRTAAGLTADGGTLILLVIDGRQSDWSIGLTLPELADLMIELGANDAVNLDGGGSSSFIFAPPGAPRITNRPSDGHWRAVGSSLGVFLRD
jgi:exopolysaccharide biosynthesis protein